IAENFGGGRDGLAVPRLEVIAVGVEIAVRANTGIAEEVPCAANRMAGLKDDIALHGALALKVAGSTEARNTCADDNDVMVFERGMGVHLCILLIAAAPCCRLPVALRGRASLMIPPSPIHLQNRTSDLPRGAGIGIALPGRVGAP